MNDALSRSACAAHADGPLHLRCARRLVETSRQKHAEMLLSAPYSCEEESQAPRLKATTVVRVSGNLQDFPHARTLCYQCKTQTGCQTRALGTRTEQEDPTIGDKDPNGTRKDPSIGNKSLKVSKPWRTRRQDCRRVAPCGSAWLWDAVPNHPGNSF